MTNLTRKRDNFRWAILFLISLSHIFGACAQYGINTLAPFYQDDLGLSHAQVGLFFTAFYLAMTSISFFAGWLTDRLGVRKAPGPANRPTTQAVSERPDAAGREDR